MSLVLICIQETVVQSINNGIDFSGEGGLVWIKRRDSSNGHFLVDTERGRASNLVSNSTSVVRNIFL